MNTTKQKREINECTQKHNLLAELLVSQNPNTCTMVFHLLYFAGGNYGTAKLYKNIPLRIMHKNYHCSQPIRITDAAWPC